MNIAVAGTGYVGLSIATVLYQQSVFYGSLIEINGGYLFK